MTDSSNTEQRINTLMRKLRIDENSILFASGDELSKKVGKKLKKSIYGRDKVLSKVYFEYVSQTGNKKVKETAVVINTPFIQEHSTFQTGDMLYSIHGPMQLFHADLPDLRFFSKSTAAPAYCLVCVDLFSSKIYTYGMKRKSHLSEKLEKFYSEIEPHRSYLKKVGRYSPRLRTDQEFNQNEIKKLNQKYRIEHFNTKLNEGQAVAAEQKN